MKITRKQPCILYKLTRPVWTAIRENINLVAVTVMRLDQRLVGWNLTWDKKFPHIDLRGWGPFEEGGPLYRFPMHKKKKTSYKKHFSQTHPHEFWTSFSFFSFSSLSSLRRLLLRPLGLTSSCASLIYLQFLDLVKLFHPPFAS